MVTKRQCGSHNKAWFSLAAQEQGQAKGSYGDVIAVETVKRQVRLFLLPLRRKNRKRLQNKEENESILG